MSTSREQLKHEIKLLTEILKKMDARKPEYRDMCERILDLQWRV